MIFDKLCGIAERHIPEFLPLLHQAHLFEFPGRSKDVMKVLPVEDAVELSRMFFLPFPVVAVEDLESCVIMMDLKDGQEGFTDKRMFVECMPLDQFDTVTMQGASPTAPKLNFSRGDFPPGSCVIRTGTFDSYYIDTTPTVERDRNVRISGYVRWWAVMSKEAIEVPARTLTTSDQEMLTQDTLTCVSAAIEEVLYFNSPSRFIVERTPLKSKHKPSETRIARSPDRPRYTTLTPGEIRETILPAQAEGHGGTKAPHPRRRHYRTLKSDRYVAAKGSTILIPSTWIGPSEGDARGHHYKVLLDR